MPKKKTHGRAGCRGFTSGVSGREGGGYLSEGGHWRSDLRRVKEQEWCSLCSMGEDQSWGMREWFLFELPGCGFPRGMDCDTRMLPAIPLSRQSKARISHMEQHLLVVGCPSRLRCLNLKTSQGYAGSSCMYYGPNTKDAPGPFFPGLARAPIAILFPPIAVENPKAPTDPSAGFSLALKCDVVFQPLFGLLKT